MTDRGHQEDVHHPASNGIDRRQHTRHFQDSAHPRTHLEVHLRQYPGWRALIHVELAGDPGQRAGDLHTAGSSSDERHPLATDVIGVVPVVGAHDPATEVVDPVDRDIGLGVDISADRTDNEPRSDDAAVGDLQAPHRAVVVPHLPHHLGVGLQVRVDAFPAGHVAQVPVDLRAGGEQPRPIRIAGERELVPQRRDVDGQAGIVVVAPGPADVPGPFQDDEVVDPVAPQQVRRGDPTGAGANDRHLMDSHWVVLGHGAHHTARPTAASVRVGTPTGRAGQSLCARSRPLSQPLRIGGCAVATG